MKKYSQSNLINSLNLSCGNDVMFLLGAGCSISSGCMSASKLVEEFKKRLFCEKHSIHYSDNLLFNEIEFKKLLDAEFCEKVENEYAYYFEKCFPNSLDRNKFIKEKFIDKRPSFGYLCFANYIVSKNIKRVLTTNFDRLCEKSIRKINENYDFTVTSDEVLPILSSKLNIVELHGDYNYSSLKNTKEELETLSNTIVKRISSDLPLRIIVIGYSGQDKSVMNCLKEILRTNNQIQLFWCSLDDNFQENENINELLSYNDESGYVLVKGFDSVFSEYYNIYGKKNDTVDSLYQKNENENFNLIFDNKPEKLELNINHIDSNSLVYCYETNEDSAFIKEVNEKNNDLFLMCYKNKIYAVGDENKLNNIFPNCLCKKVYLEDTTLNINKKCILLKNIIILSLKTNGLKNYKNNIYFENNKEIKEGLSLAVDFINGRYCLITNVNYFSLNNKLSDSIKYEINKLKSNLYASKNYEIRNKLLNEIFPLNNEFSYFCSKIKFERQKIGFGINQIDFENYNCQSEPIMITKSIATSVNQIKLLNDYGPRETIFSPDKIKVGIFCVKQDRQKLQRFLNNVIYGTGAYAKEIIPKFKGLKKTFNKDIEFIFDILPSIDINANYFKDMCFNRFADFCMRGIEKMNSTKQIDIALIYIGNNLEKFKKDGEADLHDIIKLKCANKYKTQFLEEKTIDSLDDINKRIFNLSIALYTKTIGMPWYPSCYAKDTLFLGMSFGMNSDGITVGCSQMFDGAGRGLKLIITKVSDKHKKNQYLSEEEAYSLGLTLRSTYYKTSKVCDLKRIVIHRCDPFVEEEIQGFKRAFEGIDDFDLIKIVEKTDLNSYKIKNERCDGYPLKRGTVLKTSKSIAYVWIDGSINDTDINYGKTYRNNKRGMGRPLKIIKHYGHATINETVDDLMYLSKMDFNSSDVIYSKLPVTIKYARIVCNLLKQGRFEDSLISFEYVM